MPRKTLLAFHLALGAALAPMVAGAQGMPPQGPAQVGVITAKVTDVPLIVTIPGRAVAREEVAIRPRVDGFVTQILYSPGRPIKAGTPMFQVDKTTYEAQLEQAEANLAAASAAIPQAQAAVDRSKRLQGTGSTVATLQELQATLEQAQAQQKASEAAVKLAQTQLSWTTINSPLDGVPNVATVSPGDLVTAAQADALATVTQLDPIDVEMYEPSARLQRIRDRIESGEVKSSGDLQAQLTLENGATYATAGTLVAPGYSVSTSTGAIDFRFRFENPDLRILPGMFVRGEVDIGRIQAVLVPQLAATRGNDGRLSAWVADNGKAVKRVLTDEGVYQNSWIVSSGLKDGDLLVLNGVSGLQEGADVTTVPVEMNADGVIVDTAAAPAAAPAGDAPAATDAPPAPAAPASDTAQQAPPAAE
ncbi:MAG: efflux RND transporter periplasmic adaptor subunit [Paracoccus denitrificans]|nr:MAG: efflux RND transporter periplasmic adaptor subunit [Paracoccus denitrificans]PZO83198.1 MAG: efflux RND transporter periplasmic adaptor subunit [Paracoccus denitrificans]